MAEKQAKTSEPGMQIQKGEGSWSLRRPGHPVVPQARSLVFMGCASAARRLETKSGLRRVGASSEAHTKQDSTKGSPLNACLSSVPRKQRLRQSLCSNAVLGCMSQGNKVKEKGK